MRRAAGTAGYPGGSTRYEPALVPLGNQFPAAAATDLAAAKANTPPAIAGLAAAAVPATDEAGFPFDERHGYCLSSRFQACPCSSSCCWGPWLASPASTRSKIERESSESTMRPTRVTQPRKLCVKATSSTAQLMATTLSTSHTSRLLCGQ